MTEFTTTTTESVYRPGDAIKIGCSGRFGGGVLMVWCGLVIGRTRSVARVKDDQKNVHGIRLRDCICCSYFRGQYQVFVSGGT